MLPSFMNVRQLVGNWIVGKLWQRHTYGHKDVSQWQQRAKMGYHKPTIQVMRCFLFCRYYWPSSFTVDTNLYSCEALQMVQWRLRNYFPCNALNIQHTENFRIKIIYLTWAYILGSIPIYCTVNIFWKKSIKSDMNFMKGRGYTGPI